MDEKTVKQTLLRLRKENRYSQLKIANLLGISRNAYRNLECGGTRIVNENIEKVAELTGTTKEEILLGYKPVRDVREEIIHVRDHFAELAEAERIQHEARVAALEQEIAFQQELIASLKKNISALEAYIRSLERETSAKDTVPED